MNHNIQKYLGTFMWLHSIFCYFRACWMDQVSCGKTKQMLMNRLNATSKFLLQRFYYKNLNEDLCGFEVWIRRYLNLVLNENPTEDKKMHSAIVPLGGNHIRIDSLCHDLIPLKTWLYQFLTKLTSVVDETFPSIGNTIWYATFHLQPTTSHMGWTKVYLPVISQ